MWSSIVPLLLMVIPRYLYVSVLSITMFPSLNLGSWFFPIAIVWLFSLPNLMWYLLDISSVISSIFWSSCLFLCPILVVPIFSVLISLAISSIRFAYSITDRTPPCLMLSRIFIFLVFPYLVRIVAVMFLFIFLTIFRSLPVRPLLLSAYSMAFSPALSYAFVTSRNATWRSSFLLVFLCCLIMVFRINRWSAVAFPFWPPAWASVILTVLVSLLFIIISNSLPMLLPSVIPLSLLHLPFFPLPL